jgi:DNA-binding transcriptional MerR regulator
MTESWSTAQVARMARVSSRTLRHYDHVGLLPPTRAGHTRWYSRRDLLRLQHILLLRELGLGLDDIAAVLDGGTDEVAALRHHHARLMSEAERLLLLAETVGKTIVERQGGTPMPANEIFAGFREDPYAAEARQRWGETAAHAQRRAADWDQDTAAAVQREGEDVTRGLGEALRAGRPAEDPAVQELVARHHAWVSRFWTPGREAYVGLGRMYVDDERFAAHYEAVEPGLAVYVREAIEVWAPAHLS